MKRVSSQKPSHPLKLRYTQLHAFDDAAICLHAVLAAYGFDVSFNSLKKDLNVAHSRPSFSKLAQVSGHYGVQATVSALSFDQLKFTRGPLLVQLSNNRFVLVSKTSFSAVTFLDPQSGKRDLPLKQFQALYAGYSLIFSLPKHLGPRLNPKSDYQKLTELFEIRPLLLACFGAFLGIMGGVFWKLGSVLPKLFINDYLLGAWQLPTFLMPIFLVTCLTGFFVLTFFYYGATTSVISYLSNRLDSLWIKSGLSSYFHYAYALEKGVHFYLLSRIQYLARAYTQNFLTRVSGVCFAFVTLAFMSTQNILYFVYSVVCAGLFILFNQALLHRKTPLFSVLEGASLLAKTAEEEEITFKQRMRFSQLKHLIDTQFISIRLSFISRLASYHYTHLNHRILQNAGIFFALTGGLFGMLQFTDLSIGAYLEHTLLLGGLLVSIKGYMHAKSSQQALATTAHLLVSALDLQAHRSKSTKTTPSVSYLHGTLDVENLSYSYQDKANPLFSQVKFSLRPGQWLGITGHSGSGKTTLLNLLSGIETPHTGHIRVDNTPVQFLSPLVYSHHIAYVRQESVFIHDSVMNNITMYDETITLEDARKISPLFFKRLSARFHAMSLTLSAQHPGLTHGEKTLIQLFRALTRSPKLIFIDDCLTTLDPEQEKELLIHLKKQGITTVLVTYDQRILSHCDQVLFLSPSGQAITSTHSTLQDIASPYSELIYKTEYAYA